MTNSKWLLWIGGKGCDGLLVNAVGYYNLLSSGIILLLEVTTLYQQGYEWFHNSIV